MNQTYSYTHKSPNGGIAVWWSDAPNLARRILQAELPTYELLDAPESFGRDDMRIDLPVVILLFDPNADEWRSFLQTLQSRYRRSPTILKTCFSSTRLHELGPLPGGLIVLTEPAELSLGALLERASQRDLGLVILRELERALEMPAGLRAATRRVCRAQLHPLRSSRPWYRNVSEVAIDIGCSPAYLYRSARKAGLDLGALLRHVTIIRAMEIRSTRGWSWARIAHSLGRGSDSAFANLVRRTWGMTPSAAARRSKEVWLGRTLAACLKRQTPEKL